MQQTIVSVSLFREHSTVVSRTCPATYFLMRIMQTMHAAVQRSDIHRQHNNQE
jgi:hypothetical protein